MQNNVDQRDFQNLFFAPVLKLKRFSIYLLIGIENQNKKYTRKSLIQLNF